MGSEQSKRHYERYKQLQEYKSRLKQRSENFSQLDQNYAMVASIDFGTAFCGYAYSLKTSMTDIQMNRNWGSKLGCQSYKVLYDVV